MKTNLIALLLIILGIAALYLTRVSYSDQSLKKSISACVIVQMKKSEKTNIEDVKQFCKKEIMKKMKK